MSGWDVLGGAFLGIMLFILLVLVVGNITFLVLYARVRRFINEAIARQVVRECEGAVTVDPLFQPYDPMVYNKHNALAAFWTAAALTYTHGCGHPLKIPGPDFQNIATFQAFDFMGQTFRPMVNLFYSPQLATALLCFSATVEITEWEDDFLIKQVPPNQLANYKEGMLVHEGFYTFYTGGTPNLQQQILTVLRKQLKSGDRLLITGHSLGAAVATICYFDWFKKWPTVMLYTTGCPRIGNAPFAQALNRPLNYRLFNTEDLIPSLPPPFIGPWVYAQNPSALQFTITLSSYSENHNEAYVEYLSSEKWPADQSPLEPNEPADDPFTS